MVSQQNLVFLININIILDIFIDFIKQETEAITNEAIDENKLRIYKALDNFFDKIKDRFKQTDAIDNFKNNLRNSLKSLGSFPMKPAKNLLRKLLEKDKYFQNIAFQISGKAEEMGVSLRLETAKKALLNKTDFLNVIEEDIKQYCLKLLGYLFTKNSNKEQNDNSLAIPKKQFIYKVIEYIEGCDKAFYKGEAYPIKAFLYCVSKLFKYKENENDQTDYDSKKSLIVIFNFITNILL